MISLLTLTVFARLRAIAFLLSSFAAAAGLCDPLPAERMHLVARHAAHEDTRPARVESLAIKSGQL